MTEGLINLVDDDSSQDVQGGPPGSGEEDRLATSRLQAHVPPPVPSRRAQPPQAAVPPPRPSYPTGAGAPRTMLYPSEPPAALPRTSWWRALIASTLAPAAPEEAIAERRVGAACIGFAVVFSLTALLVGLRGAPPDAPAPGIAVAVVLARGALALGLLAFGYALLRMGERLLTSRLGRRPEG